MCLHFFATSFVVTLLKGGLEFHLQHVSWLSLTISEVKWPSCDCEIHRFSQDIKSCWTVGSAMCWLYLLQT